MKDICPVCGITHHSRPPMTEKEKQEFIAACKRVARHDRPPTIISTLVQKWKEYENNCFYDYVDGNWDEKVLAHNGERAGFFDFMQWLAEQEEA